MQPQKIINDPVYGFITLDDPLIQSIIQHPHYQRLRRIHQMALAYLVYPGAVHTRLHHSLGAYHLMSNALHSLKSKGVAITAEEEQAAKIAILLHDVGHGPYSHALEHVLEDSMSHEEFTLLIMERMNHEFNGKLTLAIELFKGLYSKRFLHQLISSQLDVDRMDYLIRDSFFTGVSEGVIGYDRIIKMLAVHDGRLMIEEKGIHSIEKFLVSRRFMYWQVYLHKTVLCAEKMLVNVIHRAREIGAHSPSEPLNLFLHSNKNISADERLHAFCMLDDADVLFSLKRWALHHDTVLSTLSRGLINRNLLKIRYSAAPISPEVLEEKKKLAMQYLRVNEQEAGYLVFQGSVKSETYNPGEDRIDILFKNGDIRDISQVDDPLINQSLFGTVKKFYICYQNINITPEV